MLSAYFVMSDKSTVEISGKLAEYFYTVFSASSASSAVSKRGERAELLQKHFDKIPALKESEAIVIEDSEEIITVKTNNMVAILAGIPSAIACNDLYKQNVTSVKKNPTESGKKGRKESDLEKELLDALK